ncbi:hypothetical protein [Actinocorallia libanotica]|uniref:hypothetical protein n=1 Tax=Actinocorallia libanotica TaxID=46162 RepID=UPI0031CF5EC8
MAPAAPPPPPAEEHAAFLLPLDPYVLDESGLIRVLDATDVVAERCAKQAGVEWPAVDRPDRGPSPNRRRYGVAETLIARMYGYHPPPDPALEETTSRSERRLKELDGGEREKILGPGGCLEKARSEVNGGLGPLEDQPSESIDQISFAESKSDPKVAGALQEWTSCIISHGYSFKDPLTAASDSRWNSPTASPEEKKIALADVDCKKKSDLVRVWSSAEAKIQTRLINENRDRLGPLRELKETQLRNAARILSAPGP